MGRDAELGPGLGAVIDAEDRYNDPVQDGWDGELPGPVAVSYRFPGHRVRASRAGQGGAEGRGHRSRGPGNLHSARRRVDRGDGQPGRTQHAADHVNIGTLRAVLGTELGGAERVGALDEGTGTGARRRSTTVTSTTSPGSMARPVPAEGAGPRALPGTRR